MFSKQCLSTLLLFATGAHGNVPKADYFYHQPIVAPSMWVFGAKGVHMYTADGDLVKHLPSEEFCLPGEDRQTGETVYNCGFKGIVSDGTNYVFATNTNQGAFVEVFDINTGLHVASLPTCGFPWNIDIHPPRREVWVQCWSPDAVDGDEGHIDVFSAAALSLDLQQIATGELQSHGHGTVVVDASMPNIAYGSVLSSPMLSVIDVNTKRVLEEVQMPKVSGIYRMEYSHVNRHLFMRAYVCCSCGFEGADLGMSCGRGEPSFVDVITGPNQATNVTGKCGHSCEGSPADNIGIYEWDTLSKKIVKEHTDTTELGADPYIDPAGKYMILLGNDGGNRATIVKMGENGVASETLQTLETGFSTVDGEKGISDVCFIENDIYNIAVFASTLANFVVIADMSPVENGGGPITTQKIWLTDEDASEITSNHGRGARRNCAWAFGTNYIWVDAQKSEMVHIIELSDDGDISRAKLTRNVEGVPSRLMHWVYDHQAEALAEMISRHVQAQITKSQEMLFDPMNQKVIDLSGGMIDLSGNVESLGIDVRKVIGDVSGAMGNVQATQESIQDLTTQVSEMKKQYSSEQVSEVNNMQYDTVEDNGSADDPSDIAIAGLVLGVCAVILGIVNIVMLRSNRIEYKGNA